MSKISRFLGNVKAFASEALGTERTIFGSTAQSNALTDQINALYRRGWAGVSATETPTYQDFNALGYTLGQFIAYLHQMGIAEYHAQQEYYKGAVVIFDGNLYQAVKDRPSGQPVGNPGNWYSFKGAIDSKADATAVNSALATKADATTVNNALATKASTTYVNQQIATRETPSGAQTKVNTHANNKSNPHAVTKAQVGLGNVPNWSQATFDGRYESKGTASGLAIGVGQTWQNMLGIRAKGEPYTNNTGRPIMVSVTGHHVIELWVSGVRVAHQNTYPYRSGYVASVTGVIPDGAEYRVECNYSISLWAELR